MALTLNANLSEADYFTTKAKDGMYFTMEREERLIGRKPTTVRIVTLKAGQPVFRFASAKDGAWRWDGAWWTTKMGFTQIFKRAVGANAPTFMPRGHKLTASARMYNAVKFAWSDLDIIGWMVVKPGCEVKCFMGFGKPMLGVGESYLETNIQLCIPNLAGVRSDYFTDVRECPVSQFHPSSLMSIGKDGANLLSGSALSRMMTGGLGDF